MTSGDASLVDQGLPPWRVQGAPSRHHSAEHAKLGLTSIVIFLAEDGLNGYDRAGAPVLRTGVDMFDQ